MKELGEGSREMIVSTTGWDINPRALGVVPAQAKIAALKGQWVSDAFFITISIGVHHPKAAVLLDLIRFLLQPAPKATLYDSYLYPGPAIKDVPLSLAPRKSPAEEPRHRQ